MRSIPNPNAELSPFQHAKALPLRMPSIILVETFSDQNLGSVSRIMLNYGLSDLRLVAPQCNHLSEDARRLAVNSIDLLENARIFSTLKEAIADLQVCLATTSRSRNANFKTFSPASAAQAVIKTSNFYSSSSSSGPPFSSGIVFGPEKNGLNNIDLALCNGVINIDTFEKYPVLNLAQSVNCIGYELWNRRLTLGEQEASLSDKEAALGPGEEAAPQKELDFFFSRLEGALSERGYQANGAPGDGGPTTQQRHFRGLQGVYKRAGVTANELKMLQGMLSSLLRER